MQGGEVSAAYLREMAVKCRWLAGELFDESAAASLRKLAQEYDQAANAAEQYSAPQLIQRLTDDHP